MAEEPDWPSAPDVPEGDKLLFQAQLAYLNGLASSQQTLELEQLKAAQAGAQAEADSQAARDLEQLKADKAAEQADADAKTASIAAFHTALMEVAKGGIDRARAGADTVQKSAAAIAGVYTAALALSFSVAERPLPSRGFVPVILLGWAIVFSTAYLAYLSRARDVKKPLPHTDLAVAAMRRSIAFIKWTRSSAENRKYLLRVSVLALAFGLAALPAPFINPDSGGDDQVTVPTSPPWPVQPQDGSAELNKILYQAEVDEVAELRKSDKPIADVGDDAIWWVGCGLAILLSLLVPLGIGLFEREDDEDDDEIPGAYQARQQGQADRDSAADQVAAQEEQPPT